MPPCILGESGSTHGEQIVLEALNRSLPSDCVVYVEPILIFNDKHRQPDFVIIHPEWGVIVLEVKDWDTITKADRIQAQVRRRNNTDGWETSPVKQAKEAAHVLVSMLQRDPSLCNDQGKLAFPYTYAGVLPFIGPKTIKWLEELWGQGYVLGGQSLKAEKIGSFIEKIPAPFRRALEPSHLDHIRGIIDPRNIARNPHTLEEQGHYDLYQEFIAKERLKNQQQPPSQTRKKQTGFLDIIHSIGTKERFKYIEATAPDEVKDLRAEIQIRLVRGYAGTGKTDVLVLRANHIYETYPEKQILVTTFNNEIFQRRLKPELQPLADRIDVMKFDTLCSSIYKKKQGIWRSPQPTQGIVARMAKDYPDIEEFGIEFLSDEFMWMKEIRRTTRSEYVEGVREGRGGSEGRQLSRQLKERVFDLFENYQQRLQDLPAHDWVDLHDKTLSYISSGTLPDKQYDVVMIDEAQHFAPTWMQIIYKFLLPNGHLFLCDDPSQSVYRFFSWKQKRVEVRGRTKWLRIPYRNTRQIFRAAYSLIKDDQSAQRLLSEAGKAPPPNFEHQAVRDGPKPEIREHSNWNAEKQFIFSQIQLHLQQGVLPQEIAILHTKNHVLDAYRTMLPNINILPAREQTGTEYRVVFIPRVHELLERSTQENWRDSQSRQRFQLYMLMTRARQHLYLTYSQKWPKEFESICVYANIVNS